MDPLHSKCFALPAYRTTYFSLQPCPSQSESLQLSFWNFWYLFLHFLSLSSFLAARYHRACPPSRALHVCWSVRSALALGSSYAHAPNGRNIAYRWNRRQVYMEWRTADIYNFMNIYIYIYKRKVSIDITCVGLASARPNNYLPLTLLLRSSDRWWPF